MNYQNQKARTRTAVLWAVIMAAFHLKAGQVAASGLAPRRVFLPGRFSLSDHVYHCVESFNAGIAPKPL
jgi:hypothetical protein